MGDWDVQFHWFDCPDRATAQRVMARLDHAHHFEPWREAYSGWGLHYGYVSPLLVQAETTRKWGVEPGFADWVLADIRGVSVTVASMSGHPEYPECTGWVQTSGPPGPLSFRWTYCFVLGQVQGRTPEREWLDRLELRPLLEWEPLPLRAETIAGRPALVSATPVDLFPLAQTEWPVPHRRGPPEAVGRYEQMLMRLLDVVAPQPEGEQAVYLAFGNETPQHGKVNLAYLWLMNSKSWEVHLVGSLNPLRHEAWAGAQPYFDDVTLDDFGVDPASFGRRVPG